MAYVLAEEHEEIRALVRRIARADRSHRRGNALVPPVVELLKDQGIDDVLVTAGGTIPADDIPELKKLGRPWRYLRASLAAQVHRSSWRTWGASP